MTYHMEIGVSQGVADITRIVVIVCGAILAGSLVGIAYHHRRLTSRLHENRIRIPAGTFIMPWWASLSWVLFVIGALLPHIVNFGEESLWAFSVVFNLVAMLVGLWSLWEARFRVGAYLAFDEVSEDEADEEEGGH